MKNLEYSLNPAETLLGVVADPEAAAGSDYLYVVGMQKAYVVDRANLGGIDFFEEAQIGFGNGPAGGPHFLMSDPTGTEVRREFWTLASQATTSRWRRSVGRSGSTLTIRTSLPERSGSAASTGRT